MGAWGNTQCFLYKCCQNLPLWKNLIFPFGSKSFIHFNSLFRASIVVFFWLYHMFPEIIVPINYSFVGYFWVFFSPIIGKFFHIELNEYACHEKWNVETLNPGSNTNKFVLFEGICCISVWAHERHMTFGTHLSMKSHKFSFLIR